jgi:Kdo2-lipid IVA lauroyltransferase/acyltransferase
MGQEVSNIGHGVQGGAGAVPQEPDYANVLTSDVPERTPADRRLRLSSPDPRARPLFQRLRLAWRQSAYLAEAITLVLVMTIFAWLPVDLASAVGGYIGRKIGPRTRASRRVIDNLRRAMPENCETENRRILLGMWDNLGRAVAEYPHLAWICAAQSHRVELVNGEAVTRLLHGNEPAIFFGGHFANWEVGPSVIHRLMGEALVSVYRAPNNPWAARVLRHWLPPRRTVAKGRAGGRELLNHLRRGGHLAMLVDQKMNDGIPVPFFGRDAMTAPAIARFSLRFRCPIVPIRVERLDGARFRFTVLPPIEIADADDATADVLARMTRINAEVERWVRACPEQWLWVHRRWPD